MKKIVNYVFKNYKIIKCVSVISIKIINIIKNENEMNLNDIEWSSLLVALGIWSLILCTKAAKQAYIIKEEIRIEHIENHEKILEIKNESSNETITEESTTELTNLYNDYNNTWWELLKSELFFLLLCGVDASCVYMTGLFYEDYINRARIYRQMLNNRRDWDSNSADTSSSSSDSD